MSSGLTEFSQEFAGMAEGGGSPDMKHIPWMNIILGQSFSTKSVIPQLVSVIPTRFLDFKVNTWGKRKKNLKCKKG